MQVCFADKAACGVIVTIATQAGVGKRMYHHAGMMPVEIPYDQTP